MDTVLKLRELRARAGLSQEDVARRSKIGVKTISSFESGARIDSMKVAQLEAILAAYKVTLAQFFSNALLHELAPWESSESPSEVVTRRLDALPPHAREALIDKISSMLDAVEAILPRPTRLSPASPQHAAVH